MNTHQAIVIDPGDGADLQALTALLAEHALKVTAIVVTHAHIDHVGGAAALRRQTAAPVYMDQRDLPLLRLMDVQAGWFGMATPETADPDISPVAGTRVAAGNWQAEFLATPGHTPGSLCLYAPAEALLLAGDTLFANGIGRTDLPGGDARQILRSIRDVLLPLPESTLVVPGHGPETTIGREAANNPFLRS